MLWPSIIAIVFSVLLLLAAAELAPATVICGPQTARTVVANGQARIYVATQRGIDVMSTCHRRRRQGQVLGRRSRILSVELEGRFAALRATGRGGVGERLTVHDLLRGRITARRRYEGGADGAAAFTRIRLDRTGVAAFIAVLEADGEAVVEATDGWRYARGVNIDPSFLALAGSTLAWRRGGIVEISSLADAATPEGTLLRVGPIRIEVKGRRRPRLFANRSESSSATNLGAPTSVCVSSSSCSGVDAVQIQGPFVATRSRSIDANASTGAVRVYDLVQRRSRQACAAERVGAFVLTRAGAVACALRGPSIQIRSEARVLDEGPGVDIDSLARSRDQLVWLHDGTQRRAPLPTPPAN